MVLQPCRHIRHFTPLRRTSADNVVCHPQGHCYRGMRSFSLLPIASRGMLGCSAFDFANLDIATKSAVADGVTWQIAVGKSRDLIYQQLTFAHMRSQYRIYPACGETL
eukprot:3462261-Amphidinium_carterae.2